MHSRGHWNHHFQLSVPMDQVYSHVRSLEEPNDTMPNTTQQAPGELRVERVGWTMAERGTHRRERSRSKALLVCLHSSCRPDSPTQTGTALMS
ncbi:unnamed protein product [Pleuronectes platessa]|uniref:Uncharacterized protein n=1 Tax=Pleuronectes platessa TaxID=8262 RepID=A0A9N7Z0Y5_PLEPL|nr:unnamed protein product [Pleuronectes platessa]